MDKSPVEETMNAEPEQPRSTIPPLAAHLAQQTGCSLIQREMNGRPYMPAGPMFFIFSYWLFQTGGLLGYGLKEHPAVISRLLFGEADPTEVAEYLHDESDDLLTRLKGSPKNLVDLYLAPLLASVGIDYHDKAFIEGDKAGWASEKQYDMDTLDKNAWLALRQGVATGYKQPEVFKWCWEATYAAEPVEQWKAAFKKGLVDAPEQEILLFGDEVARVLRETADWAEKHKETGVLQSDIDDMRRIAGDYKSS
jgi:hypothetical protein